MTFKQLMDLYDDWNGITRVNDNSLNKIVEDRTEDIVKKRQDLYDLDVVSFGFQEEGFYYIFTVRVRTKDEYDEEFTVKELEILNDAMILFKSYCGFSTNTFDSISNKIKRKIEKERENE